jgi:hypothetical protein
VRFSKTLHMLPNTSVVWSYTLHLHIIADRPKSSQISALLSASSSMCADASSMWMALVYFTGSSSPQNSLLLSSGGPPASLFLRLHKGQRRASPHDRSRQWVCYRQINPRHECLVRIRLLGSARIYSLYCDFTPIPNDVNNISSFSRPR